MRAILLTFSLLLVGCTNVQVISQSLEEGVSEVVYTITEPTTPKIKPPPPRPTNLASVPRPEPNPINQKIVAVEPFTPYQLRIQTATNLQNITLATEYLGFTETKNRAELRDLMNIDPRTIEWCAAFVNSILNENNIPGSESVSQNPLLARSFLDWGDPIDHKDEDPIAGDIVIFPRGRSNWQGHVGFFVESVNIDGKEYWRILGGNQNNSVSIQLYDPKRVLGVRRYQYTQVATEQGLINILRNVFRNI